MTAIFVSTQLPIGDYLRGFHKTPTLVAMVVSKVSIEKSEFGPITKRSLVVGQLIFDKSIALEMEKKAKDELPVQPADPAAEPKPARKTPAPWSRQTRNKDGDLCPIHENIKDPSKLYVAIDQMKGPEKATYYNAEGEELPREKIEPLLKKTSDDLAPVNYRLYGTASVVAYAFCNAPENFDEVPAQLLKLATALEGKQS